MGKYRVAYATGSRADYGIVKNFLRLLDNDKDIEFSVLVTGSHLEDKFGHSVDIIRQDTINIGDRQRGRVHGNSVIDVTCDSSMIGQAMKEIIGKNEEIINPYYVENTAENYYKKTKEILENGTSILKEFYDIV